MKNPFKPEHSAQDRDNPVIPNALERPVERAADRAAVGDNPLVPNAIERPVERAMANDSGAVINRAGSVDRAGVDAGAGDTRQMDLFPKEELGGYRTRWDAIQTGFVDQPRA